MKCDGFRISLLVGNAHPKGNEDVLSQIFCREIEIDMDPVEFS